MEMLVVLVITGIISTLLIQGLSHVLNLRIHFLSLLETESTNILQIHWFQEITASLTPGYPDDKNLFSGNKVRFQGLSLAPLKGIKGVPTLITMELISQDDQILLQYKEGDDITWEIARWSSEKAAFSYLDKDHNWYEQWKPQGFSEEEASQLPQGILLKVETIHHPIIWFSNLPARHDPAPRIKDFIKNL